MSARLWKILVVAFLALWGFDIVSSKMTANSQQAYRDAKARQDADRRATEVMRQRILAESAAKFDQQQQNFGNYDVNYSRNQRYRNLGSRNYNRNNQNSASRNNNRNYQYSASRNNNRNYQYSASRNNNQNYQYSTRNSDRNYQHSASRNNDQHYQHSASGSNYQNYQQRNN
ncbi:hypothetical protein F441_02192 [Phytophthora nicotianae CJ01A1]|uniref:RxLR effector protein n=6 Tax=Phytophthora nicotianae TaxID=4792 RepID=W2QNP1_PHYN3|nr:hypothetical protein PPTG_22008 [Phytophthora nicotianae INRA-310]ETK94910.1 hypothetical protein L915_02129 [Phytophthora nicotianae]ETO83829.1 hypothetical protein F444_02225 [Phytophthora nicotianae P1976]ETP24873.1 hypothetical protein F441_02192 [Phytophthora nicotianae CJ01A1]ETL48303.1 hypothetical protein L916_02093 [Phytophthora nicotianae]ETN14782.1 hypothetical protein PPTG_22008 [Phytophthora nicotianae INRA-310]